MSLICCKEYFKELHKMGLSEVIKKYEKMSSGRTRAKRDLDFGNGKYPEFLLSPVICKGDITILYAGKGLGKTLLALAMAYTVALGRSLFGLWRCQKPSPTLYLDGEIGETGLGARKSACRKSFGIQAHKNTDLWFASDRFNLYSKEDRQFVEEEIKRINSCYTDNREIQFLVIDNLTSMQDGKDYTKGWEDFFTWCTEQQNIGISILILFHANDDDRMRGSKMKLINADNIIFVDRFFSENNEEDDDTETKPKKRKSSKKIQPVDRSKIQMNVVFENLRNNKFPEAYASLVIEYSIPDFKWIMLNYDEYYRKVLEGQASNYSDKKMTEFWGIPERSVRELRNKFGINKYKK